MAKSSIDLNAWDAELAGKSPNYEKLYNQMLQASKESPDNVEIWSRLAQITYMVSLNLTEETSIKSKTLEGFQKAEKALSLDMNNFRANLWMAFIAGKLALMGSNLQAKMKYTVAFFRSLEVCTRLNPSEPMVLFLEGRLQLALTALTEEEKAAIKQELPLPEFNFDEAVAKLRDSIGRSPQFIDAYITLAYLLTVANKVADAKEVIQRGLAVERLTKSDHMVADELQKLDAHLSKM